MTQVTEVLRDECAAEWAHLLNDTFSTPMAVEHLAQFVLSHREQAVQEAVAPLQAEIEEQARIIGAGGERELALMAQVAERDATIAELEAKLATVQRNYDELAELIDEAHAVLQETDNG